MIKQVVAGMLVLFTLSGCSEIRKATSEAYRLGFAEGESINNLGAELDVFESWFGDSVENLDKLTSEKIREYCEVVWPVAGLLSGIENSASNKADFIDGCVAGSGK